MIYAIPPTNTMYNWTYSIADFHEVYTSSMSELEGHLTKQKYFMVASLRDLFESVDNQNNLPPDVLHCNTLNTYKKHLKTHLFTSNTLNTFKKHLKTHLFTSNTLNTFKKHLKTHLFTSNTLNTFKKHLKTHLFTSNTLNTFKKHLKTHLFTSSLTSPDSPVTKRLWLLFRKFLLGVDSNDCDMLQHIIIIIIFFFNYFFTLGSKDPEGKSYQNLKRNSWMAKGAGRRHSQTTHAAKLHWNAAKRSRVVDTRIVPPYYYYYYYY